MSIVLFFAIIYIYVFYKVYKKKQVNQYLMVYFGFSFFLWVLFPSLVSLWNSRYEQELVVSRDVFIQYAVYEYLFYITLMILLYFFPYSKPFYYGKFIPNTERSIKRIWYVLSFFLIINILKQLISNITYSDVNDSILLEEQETNIFSIFSNFAICLYISLVLFYKQFQSNIYLILSWILLSANIVTVLAHGARMQIIFYMFIFVYHIIVNTRNKKKLFLYVGILGGVLYLSSYILPAVAYIRSGGNFTVEDLIKSHEDFGEENAFLLQLLIKSNSINTGAILVEDDNDKPYFKPYINSIYSICPSIIYPGKRPMAGSKDGTIDGLPTRLAAHFITGDSRFFNVGVSTSATVLWHGGIVFYLINLIFIFFWYRFLNSLLCLNHFYANMLVVYFTILGYFILPTVDSLIRDLLKQPFFYLFFILTARGLLISDLIYSLKKHAYITK